MICSEAPAILGITQKEYEESLREARKKAIAAKQKQGGVPSGETSK